MPAIVWILVVERAGYQIEVSGGEEVGVLRIIGEPAVGGIGRVSKPGVQTVGAAGTVPGVDRGDQGFLVSDDYRRRGRVGRLIEVAGAPANLSAIAVLRRSIAPRRITWAIRRIELIHF